MVKYILKNSLIDIRFNDSFKSIIDLQADVSHKIEYTSIFWLFHIINIKESQNRCKYQISNIYFICRN